MAFEGTYDIYRCDECGATAWVRPGGDVNWYPEWTNQAWHYPEWEGRKARCLCRDCYKKTLTVKAATRNDGQNNEMDLVDNSNPNPTE